MIALIDTHCHLGDSAFALDREQVMVRMRTAGMAHALVIESELHRLGETERWLGTQPGLALASGCHPHDARHWNAELATTYRIKWSDGSLVGAGEMGLDYHYDHSPRAVQLRVFDEQLGMATECDLPAIIHAREADEDVVTVLENHPTATVVLHSFSSGPALRDAGLKNGWYFSFSGMVTFNSWRDTDAVRAVSTERLLIETDSPYLAPTPHRGKRNEPAFVVEVANKVAQLREQPVEEIAAITTQNAQELFWPQSDMPVESSGLPGSSSQSFSETQDSKS